MKEIKKQLSGVKKRLNRLLIKSEHFDNKTIALRIECALTRIELLFDYVGKVKTIDDVNSMIKIIDNARRAVGAVRRYVVELDDKKTEQIYDRDLIYVLHSLLIVKKRLKTIIAKALS